MPNLRGSGDETAIVPLQTGCCQPRRQGKLQDVAITDDTWMDSAGTRTPSPEALMRVLLPVACAGGTITYQALAAELGLEPPHTIHRVTLALEALMAADARAGRPPLAVVVVSRTRGGLPAPGFFAAARRLGFIAPAEHAPAELHRALHEAVTGAARSGVWSPVDARD